METLSYGIAILMGSIMSEIAKVIMKLRVSKMMTMVMF